MTDRPIIFSGPMVRALLAGRKSQTRRIFKVPAGSYVEQGRVWAMTDGCAYGDKALPYAPGDRLYVREAWRTEARFDDRKPLAVPPGEWIWFEAQNDVPFEPSAAGRLRPGMFMPRWASRITLTVTKVRVQRLADLTDADAIAEGVHAVRSLSEGSTAFSAPSHVESFRGLWNSLHGPDAWDANPWVVAVSFIPHLTNIDAPYLEMTDLAAGNFIARNIPVGMTGNVLCPVITAAP